MMQVRQALREQSPSLALQRAAMDEIAKLDAYIIRLEDILVMSISPEEINKIQKEIFTTSCANKNV